MPIIKYADGQTDSDAIVLTDNSTVLEVDSGTATQSGFISQSGGLFGVEKNGAGTLVLSAANGYSGGTKISGGTLAVAADDNLGATTGSITLQNGTLRFDSQFDLAATRNIAFSRVGASDAGGGTFDTQDFTTTVSQSISGHGQLTKTGSGTLILAGDNSYDGPTIVSAGTLQIGNGGSSGSAPNFSIVLYDTTLVLDRSDAFTLSIPLGGEGSVVQAGTGTSILTYMDVADSISFTIQAGTLQFGSLTTGEDVLSDIIDNATLACYNGYLEGDISGTGRIEYFGTGKILGTVSNTGGLHINAGATLTIGGYAIGEVDSDIVDDGTVDFGWSAATVFSHAISGSGMLTNYGTGTLILTGENTFTGGIYDPFYGPIQIGNGGTNGSVTGSIAFSQLSFDRSDHVAISNLLTGGTLTLKGGGLYTLTNTSNSYRTLLVQQNSTLVVDDAREINFSQGGSGLVLGDTATAGTIRLAGDVTWSGLTLGQGGGTVDTAGHQGAIALPPYAISSITGKGALTKTGAGTLVLTGGGDYTGGTEIDAGAIQIKSDRQMGTGPVTFDGGALQWGASFDVSATKFLLAANGGAFDTQGFSAIVDATITGSGGLTKLGTGKLWLGQQNSFTGGITLIAGTLDAIWNGALGSGPVDVGAGTLLELFTLQQTIAGLSGSGNVTMQQRGTLTIDGDGDSSFGGTLSGLGELIHAGTGSFTLAGNNSFSGTTMDNAGTLIIDGSMAASIVTVGSGATLRGAGTIGSVDVRGTFAPGDDGYAGFSVNGAVTLEKTAIYDVQVARNNYTSVAAAGMIDIAGKLVVDLTDSYYQPGTTYDILWSSTGVSGTFDTVQVNGLPAGMKASITYASSNVYLTISYAAPSDFNGDGKADILWQNSDGTAAVWLMDGATLNGGNTIGNPGSASWVAIGTGDFDGGGKADILWQNTDGTAAVWLMNGATLSGGGIPGNPGAAWTVLGASDFNGDGKSDILWRDGSGNIAIWLMNGPTLTGGAVAGNPGNGWSYKGTGDFDGDGKTDLVFQNSDGSIAVWLMNGAVIAGGGVVGNPDTSWSVKAVGDFDGDGKSDLLLQDTSGQAAIWEMNGASVIGGGLAGSNPGTAWTVKEAEDANGDGKADILWQAGDGSPAVWLMNGTTVTGGGIIGGNPGSSWHVVTG